MSTAMLSQPATVAIPSAIAASAGPASPAKKRRRRAPATGAAEDCFTCRANGIKCDRRRPYCGPCLDVGMECKGYRTQLTWGVGVASRGKLRGLHLPIHTPAVDPKDAKKVVKKKGDEKSSSGNENGLRLKRSKTSLDGNGRDYDNQRNGNNGTGKLSIITSYDFVNMEPPSNSSSAVSRTSSTLSANSSAMSAGASPAISAIPRSSMPSQRITQNQKSPQSSSSYTSSYSATSQPQYHIQSQQQQYQQSPVHHYHKSPYSHVSLPPQQPTSSMLLSPMSEYEPKYEPNFPSSQHYPMSSAPSTAPLYEMVTGVSSASYRPSASMTVTTTGVSYAPMVASMHATSRMMNDDHLHNHNHHNQNGGPGWNGVGVGIGNLHHQHVPAGTGNLSDLLYDDDMLAIADSEFAFTSHYHTTVTARGPTQATGRDGYLPVSNSSSSPSPFSIHSPLPPQFADLPANLRFFIDYYDKTVCASIVTFDGPGNPYRQQILQMAFSNEALMEAIYALSSSHLQSKKRGALIMDRRSSPSRLSLIADPPISKSRVRSHSPTSQSSSNGTCRAISSPPDAFQKLPHPSAISSAKDNSSELSVALEHKNASIKLLNARLANPHLAKTDSAMATLLILLLYHICETGVGQFKTHLAGVKKLMGMRGVGKETQKWGWMETVFTWLDNMSASVNNREAQLRGGYLDMIFESSDEWDLESLTGCDRDLFMRLAGLGRINMLSQMAPTTTSNYPDIEDDGETEPYRDEDDGRDDFWLAWNAMKADLSGWRPTTIHAATPSRHRSQTPTSPTSPSSTPKPSKAHEAVENGHWLHASNVYRHAVLLYLSRLAYPHLSPSHSIFQNTVREILDHVNCLPTTGLGSRLFWPLFITGTECVVDAHRDFIRARCADMQRDSGFFNKVNGLEVLERIWSSSNEAPKNRSIGGRGLRWRVVTGGEDAEYLMI